MGRQVHFHMLPEDRDAFLRFVQERDPVSIPLGRTLAAENLPYPAVQRSSTVNDAGFYDNDAGR